MGVTNAMGPTKEQLEALLNGPDDGPVWMVSLLKFKDKAEYPDGRETDLTGAQA